MLNLTFVFATTDDHNVNLMQPIKITSLRKGICCNCSSWVGCVLCQFILTWGIPVLQVSCSAKWNTSDGRDSSCLNMNATGIIFLCTLVDRDCRILTPEHGDICTTMIRWNIVDVSGLPHTRCFECLAWSRGAAVFTPPRTTHGTSLPLLPKSDVWHDHIEQSVNKAPVNLSGHGQVESCEGGKIIKMTAVKQHEFVGNSHGHKGLVAMRPWPLCRFPTRTSTGIGDLDGIQKIENTQIGCIMGWTRSQTEDHSQWRYDTP